MRNDEFGSLPPEDAPLGDEFHAAKDPSGVKLNKGAQKQAAGRKRQQIRFLMKMFASTTAAVVVISTTPGFDALAHQNDRTPVQFEQPAEAEGTAGGSTSNGTGGSYEDPSGESSAFPVETSSENSDEAEPSGETETSSETETSEPESSEIQALFCSVCYGAGYCVTCHNNRYVQCDTISSSCSFCKGSGVKLCPDCGGDGMCHTCGGTGEGTLALEAAYVPCETCEGNGILCGGSAPADDPEGCHGSVVSHCLACNNTGLQDGRPCSWCKGTLVHLCPSFEVHRTCSDCGGLGLVPQ